MTTDHLGFMQIREDIIRIKSFIGSELGYENETKGNIGYHIDRLDENVKGLQIKFQLFEQFNERLTKIETLLKVIAWGVPLVSPVVYKLLDLVL